MPIMSRYETLKRGMININTFTIKAKLPSLNDVIDKNRTNRFAGNNFKQEIQEVIGWEIKQALTKKTLKPVENPCIIEIEWHEKTRRRDVDNIQSSQKFILDALVQNKVLKNDSQRYVKQVYHQVYKDNDDFVVVTIKEI